MAGERGKGGEGSPVEIAGRRLVCPVCQGERFTTRRTLLNTRGATFFGLDWANRNATNHICGRCGYIFWFLPKDYE
jgi:hypothetical protein